MGQIRPNTYTSSFLQLLFPSPDEVTFVANQAFGDPISTLKPKDIAEILQALQQFQTLSKKKKTTDSLKEMVFTLFSFQKTDMEDVEKHYWDFLSYDLYKNLYLNIHEVTEEIWDDPQMSRIIFSDIETSDEASVAKNLLERIDSSQQLSPTEFSRIHNLLKKYEQYREIKQVTKKVLPSKKNSVLFKKS